MPVVVFDVNVLISSLIVRGKPQELWRRAKSKEFSLVLSEEILAEFVSVISRPKFEKYVTQAEVELFLNELQATGTVVHVKSRFKVVVQDPDDDIIVRVAYDANAQYIVSGDRHLLDLKEIKGIRILTVDEMLKVLRRKQ